MKKQVLSIFVGIFCLFASGYVSANCPAGWTTSGNLCLKPSYPAGAYAWEFIEIIPAITCNARAKKDALRYRTGVNMTAVNSRNECKRGGYNCALQSRDRCQYYYRLCNSGFESVKVKDLNYICRRTCTSAQLAPAPNSNYCHKPSCTLGTGWTLYKHNSFKQISVRNANTSWAIDRNYDLFKPYVHPTQGPWAKVSSTRKYKHVSVGQDGTVWAIDTHSRIWRKASNSTTWIQIQGGLQQVSVAKAGFVVGVNHRGYIYRRSGNRWIQIVGQLSHVSVGIDGTIVGVNSTGAIWTRSYHSTAPWTRISGKLKQVAVWKNNHFIGVDFMNQVLTYTNGVWRKLGGGIRQVSVAADGTVYGLDCAGKVRTRKFNAPLKAGFTYNLPLTNGWSNYLHTYAPATFIKQGDIVVVNGLIKGTHWGHLATLPVGHRPRGRLIFNLNNHGQTARVDVFPNGQIHWVYGGKSHNWISLSGIIFSTAAGQSATLHSRWKNYGFTYDGIRVAKSDHIVTLSGLLQDKQFATSGAKGWGHLATLPVGYRPTKRLIFNMNHHQYTIRVDVLPNGQVLWSGGGGQHPWISLSGIIFATTAGQALSYSNGWRDYGGVYLGAQAHLYGPLIIVSGLVYGTQWGKAMVTLPALYRPSARMIINVNNHAKTARADVLNTGQIIWVAGGRDHKWLSLSGTTFVINGPTR